MANISSLVKGAEEAIRRRNYDLAIFKYIRALALEPKNLDVRGKLRAVQNRAASENGGGSGLKATIGRAKATMLATLGKHEQAIIACEEALKHAPQNGGLLRQLAVSAEKAEFIELAAWQRQQISDGGDEDIDNLWELAELYLELKRGGDAIRIYERIKEIDPGADVDGEIRTAQAEKTSETFATAVQQGSRAIVKDAEEADRLELDAGNIKTDDQRERVIKHILENDAKDRPNDHRVYIRLGELCYDMDDFDQGYDRAKEYFGKALELNASDSSVKDKLGDLEIKRYRMRVRDLQKQAKENPQDQELRTRLQQENQERVAYEVAEFERRVKDQPLKMQFHYRLGELYFQTQRYDEAVGELQQASRDPAYRINALTMLGRSFISLKQFEMAVTQFQKARADTEIFEKIRDPLYFEAQAEEAMGSAESLRKALELYTRIYETDINYRDVKVKVPELQQRVKQVAS